MRTFPSRLGLLAVWILSAGFLLAGCIHLQDITTTNAPISTSLPTASATVQPKLEIPFEEAWSISPHSAQNAQNIPDWNNPSKRSVDSTCVGCHTAEGFNQLLTEGSTESAPFPTGTIPFSINCETCHSSAAQALSSVKFPSGEEIAGSGGDTICLACHQGTGSTETVQQALTDAGNVDSDTILEASSGLTWVDSHDGAAASVLMGSSAHSGYEYQGKTYSPAADHPAGDSTCTSCHDAHSLQVRVDTCQKCHLEISTTQDARALRTVNSNVDYDGDGDLSEGLAYEIETLRGMLYQALQIYAKEAAAAPIVYDQQTYPYFFIDRNADGKTDPDEVQPTNSYTGWTPRLFKAAYNYRFASADSGGYAHNGAYLIELLYDSIEDLNKKISTPIDLSHASRSATGHFDSASTAFRQWDEANTVPAACSRCHTSTGAAQYALDEVSTRQYPAVSLECSTCHSDLRTFALKDAGDTSFPAGVRLGYENIDDASNLCLSCHTGTTSGADVTATTGTTRADEPSGKMDLPLQHSDAAAAILFGSEAHSLYEYPGQKYSTNFYHPGGGDTCLSCHDAHTLKVDGTQCVRCHGVSDPKKVRWVNATQDYNGNGNLNEGLAEEIESLKQQLYAKMQWYAGVYMDTPMAYTPDTSPYYFKDNNNNGMADPEEINPQNAFTIWTPRLLRAAYNYHAIASDAGAYAHNGDYVLQILFDAIRDMGGSVKGLARPTP